MEKYESLRNGKIGTVVSKTEDEVVLDFDGVQKTIRMGNLKRWYKFCGLSEEEIKKDESIIDKNAKLIERVTKSENFNGDIKIPDCSKLVSQILTYLENKGCFLKKTCSYTRVRVGKSAQNVMEVWWGKKIRTIKIVVRREAMSDPEILKLGKTSPLTNYYTLDHYFRFDYTADITKIYKIIDMAVDYENNYVQREKIHNKRGTGKIGDKNTLNYKRKNLGIYDNETLQKYGRQTLVEDVQELENKLPVTIQKD